MTKKEKKTLTFSFVAGESSLSETNGAFHQPHISYECRKGKMNVATAVFAPPAADNSTACDSTKTTYTQTDDAIHCQF